MILASVIIPTYNRRDPLRACLDALARQTAPASDFEVVVVVDGSTDGTLEMLNAYPASFVLQVIQQPNRGQCAALNQGVEAARGEILIFTDDDILASPEFVREHIRLHHSGQNVVGFGKITISLPHDADWYARIFAREWAKHYDALDRVEREPSFMDCYGGNMSVARSAYLAVGGNAEDLHRAYDLDLAYRLKLHGCAFTYLPLAACDQMQTKGLRELALDSEKSGAACVELSKRHPALLEPLLGGFGEQRPSMATFLRILLALNVSPGLLEIALRLAGPRLRTEQNYHRLQRYRFWRAVRTALPAADWQPLTQGIPILMYHAFGDPGEPASRYILPVRRFAQQMALLKWLGYHVLSLRAYLEIRAEHRLPPDKSVILTIDDGYGDTFRLAYPVLRRYQYVAAIFPVTQVIGGKNIWSRSSGLDGRPMLTWDEIRAMREGGMEFGAHTCTHPRLTEISLEAARAEIEDSRAELAGALGVEIAAFCYPYGLYNPQILALAKEAGYLGSLSVDYGKNTLATPLHRLRRIEIAGTDSLLSFALAVRYGLPRQVFLKQIIR